MSSGPAPSDIVREAAEQDSKASVEVTDHLECFWVFQNVLSHAAPATLAATPPCSQSMYPQHSGAFSNLRLCSLVSGVDTEPSYCSPCVARRHIDYHRLDTKTAGGHCRDVTCQHSFVPFPRALSVPQLNMVPSMTRLCCTDAVLSRRSARHGGPRHSRGARGPRYTTSERRCRLGRTKNNGLLRRPAASPSPSTSSCSDPLVRRDLQRAGAVHPCM